MDQKNKDKEGNNLPGKDPLTNSLKGPIELGVSDIKPSGEITQGPIEKGTANPDLEAEITKGPIERGETSKKI